VPVEAFAFRAPFVLPLAITEATAEQVQHDKHHTYDNAITRIP